MISKNNFAIFKVFDIWIYLTSERKREISLLFFLMVIVTFFEMLGVVGIFPILTLLVDSGRADIVLEKTFLINLTLNFDFNPIIFVLTGYFLIISLSAFLGLLLLRLCTKISFVIGNDVGSQIYKNVLNQPYEKHFLSNSSNVIDVVTVKTGAVSQAFLQTLNFLSAMVMLVISIVLLGLYFFLPTILTVTFAFLIYFIVGLVVKKKQDHDSAIIAYQTTRLMKILQESMGGIRDVILDRSQNILHKEYVESDLLLKRAHGNNSFISAAPKYIVEFLGLTILIGYLYFQISRGAIDIHNSVPTLGVIALGAQRILSIFQQAYRSWSGLQGWNISLMIVMNCLRDKYDSVELQSATAKYDFINKISFQNVSYRYPGSSKNVLNSISIDIQKGEALGIIGETGSGKSTLLDLILGLIHPTNGKFMVDGVLVDSLSSSDWQNEIAHVSQHVFLMDATIAENIAFGVRGDAIDMNLVFKAGKISCVEDFVGSLHMGYQTLVGERGARLSGGQIQRIGIARAIYKMKKILILDEATSSLDEFTEHKVMENIKAFCQGLTLIMVSHRTSTLKNCNRLVKLCNGALVIVQQNKM